MSSKKCDKSKGPWVSKREARPYKKIMDECMNDIRKNIKKNGITFEYFLVGSSKRNLIVRHHNKGFDCDYQIHVRKNLNCLNPDKYIKLFEKQISSFLKKKEYSYESSTSALTYKNKDTKKSKIIHSFDIVFIKEVENSFEIARHHDNGVWRFEQLPASENHKTKLEEINSTRHFPDLKKEYLKEKQENEKLEKWQRKKSFKIFIDSVNEVFKIINL